MNRNERILVWLLRLGGAVMLTALGAVVLPFDWMNSIHGQVGLGELPHVPIVGYLTRSISALYALHGALLVFLAGDVRRYLPVVRFLALAGVVFGVMMLAIDCAVGMPLSWTVGEGPFVVAFGVVNLWLAGRVQPTAGCGAG
ncbi:MAG TPA: hypothetical protein VJA21_12175 [Verrucomicrobiae bacterium]